MNLFTTPLECPQCRHPLRRMSLWDWKFWRAIRCPTCSDELTIVRPFGQQILVVLLYVALSAALPALLPDLPRWLLWLVAAALAIAVDGLLLICTSSVRKSTGKLSPR